MCVCLSYTNARYCQRHRANEEIVQVQRARLLYLAEQRQNSHIDAERLVSHCTALLDLATQGTDGIIRVGLRHTHSNQAKPYCTMDYARMRPSLQRCEYLSTCVMVIDVTIPRPPAFDTAAAISANPTWCMPPWRMGTSTPTISVKASKPDQSVPTHRRGAIRV